MADPSFEGGLLTFVAIRQLYEQLPKGEDGLVDRIAVEQLIASERAKRGLLGDLSCGECVGERIRFNDFVRAVRAAGLVAGTKATGATTPRKPLPTPSAEIHSSDTTQLSLRDSDEHRASSEPDDEVLEPSMSTANPLKQRLLGLSTVLQEVVSACKSPKQLTWRDDAPKIQDIYSAFCEFDTENRNELEYSVVVRMCRQLAEKQLVDHAFVKSRLLTLHSGHMWEFSKSDLLTFGQVVRLLAGESHRRGDVDRAKRCYDTFPKLKNNTVSFRVFDECGLLGLNPPLPPRQLQELRVRTKGRMWMRFGEFCRMLAHPFLLTRDVVYAPRPGYTIDENTDGVPSNTAVLSQSNGSPEQTFGRGSKVARAPTPAKTRLFVDSPRSPAAAEEKNGGRTRPLAELNTRTDVDANIETDTDTNTNTTTATTHTVEAATDTDHPPPPSTEDLRTVIVNLQQQFADVQMDEDKPPPCSRIVRKPTPTGDTSHSPSDPAQSEPTKPAIQSPPQTIPLDTVARLFDLLVPTSKCQNQRVLLSSDAVQALSESGRLEPSTTQSVLAHLSPQQSPSEVDFETFARLLGHTDTSSLARAKTLFDQLPHKQFRAPTAKVLSALTRAFGSMSKCTLLVRAECQDQASGVSFEELVRICRQLSSSPSAPPKLRLLAGGNSSSSITRTSRSAPSLLPKSSLGAEAREIGSPRFQQQKRSSVAAGLRSLRPSRLSSPAILQDYAPSRNGGASATPRMIKSSSPTMPSKGYSPTLPSKSGSPAISKRGSSPMITIPHSSTALKLSRSVVAPSVPENTNPQSSSKPVGTVAQLRARFPSVWQQRLSRQSASAAITTHATATAGPTKDAAQASAQALAAKIEPPPSAVPTNHGSLRPHSPRSPRLLITSPRQQSNPRSVSSPRERVQPLGSSRTASRSGSGGDSNTEGLIRKLSSPLISPRSGSPSDSPRVLISPSSSPRSALVSTRQTNSSPRATLSPRATSNAKSVSSPRSVPSPRSISSPRAALSPRLSRIGVVHS